MKKIMIVSTLLGFSISASATPYNQPVGGYFVNRGYYACCKDATLPVNATNCQTTANGDIVGTTNPNNCGTGFQAVGIKLPANSK